MPPSSLPHDAPLLLRRARLLAAPGLYDVLIVGGRISAVAPTGAGTDPSVFAEAVDLDGRVLAPGLWDEHVHFTQWVIRRSRFDLSSTRSAADVLVRVREEMSARGSDPERTLTGYGFRDGTWPDTPSLAALDAVTGRTPVILISADLHCAWMNSAAGARTGHRLDETGLVREEPWLQTPAHLRDDAAPTLDGYRSAAEAAARRGVVGIVEFEHADNPALWPERVEAGIDTLRVETSIWPEYLDAAIADGRRTGDVLDPRGLVTMGPLKVVVDGSLNTRTAWCWDPYATLPAAAVDSRGLATVAPDRLAELLAKATRHGIAPAVHAIGDRAVSEVLDLFERYGSAGAAPAWRIEHAQFVSASDFARFGSLGVIASVQPEHALDDRDVADLHWAGRTERAFAFASLHAGGAALRLGSDAPVAPLDPWIALAAAVSRARAGEEPWHPEQAVALDVALAASMRGRTAIAPGEPADLVVLDVDPFAVAPAQLRELPVAATLVAGRWTWRSL